MEKTNDKSAQEILDEIFELTQKITHIDALQALDTDENITPKKAELYALLHTFLRQEEFQKIINNPKFIGE